MRSLRTDSSLLSPSKRGTHYSSQLGSNELRAIQAESGIPEKDALEILVFIENHPSASAAFWESLLNVYPVDWRQNPSPLATNFKLYDYSLPVTPPYFVPGVMSNSERSSRIFSALESNKARFEGPLRRLVAHRASYTSERDTYMSAAALKFTGETLECYQNMAVAAGHESRWPNNKAASDASLYQAALALYRQDVFSAFCNERDIQTQEILSEVLGEFNGLSSFQVNAKVFVDHALPAYNQYAPKLKTQNCVRHSAGSGPGSPAL